MMMSEFVFGAGILVAAVGVFAVWSMVSEFDDKKEAKQACFEACFDSPCLAPPSCPKLCGYLSTRDVLSAEDAKTFVESMCAAEDVR